MKSSVSSILSVSWRIFQGIFEERKANTFIDRGGERDPVVDNDQVIREEEDHFRVSYLPLKHSPRFKSLVIDFRSHQKIARDFDLL